MLTSLRLTRFLTLNLTSVTSHEAFCLQCSFVFRINLHQRTCDSQTQSLCLTFETTTVKIYLDIVFLSDTELIQRLENDIAQNRRREICLDVTAIDLDLAGPCVQSQGRKQESRLSAERSSELGRWKGGMCWRVYLSGITMVRFTAGCWVFGYPTMREVSVGVCLESGPILGDLPH